MVRCVVVVACFLPRMVAEATVKDECPQKVESRLASAANRLSLRLEVVISSFFLRDSVT